MKTYYIEEEVVVWRRTIYIFENDEEAIKFFDGKIEADFEESELLLDTEESTGNKELVTEEGLVIKSKMKL